MTFYAYTVHKVRVFYIRNILFIYYISSNILLFYFIKLYACNFKIELTWSFFSVVANRLSTAEIAIQNFKIIQYELVFKNTLSFESIHIIVNIVNFIQNH